MATCCCPTSAQCPSAHGRVSARCLLCPPTVGLFTTADRGKYPPGGFLFFAPLGQLSFCPQPFGGQRVRSESSVRWPLAATPASLGGLFLTRRVSSPQGAPVRGPSFFHRLPRFQFHVLGAPESQAEAEHVLESHHMFDDLWKVPALSVTRRRTVVGCEEALRCSR